MNKLSELKVSFEEYGRKSWNASKKSDDDRRMMNDDERAFLAGTILHTKPKNVLELGVEAGGGSALILQLIQEWGGRLTSIDLATKLIHNYGELNEEPIGIDALNIFNVSSADEILNWRLYTGCDASEVIEEATVELFDFVVLDTAHLLPVESLNFLTIFPYLSESAILVMHDIGHSFRDYFPLFPRIVIGNKLLMDQIVAESKHYLSYSEYNGNQEIRYSNIVAMQLNYDTKKYIDNVFSGLNFPWGIYPGNTLKNILNILEKHYTKKQVDLFKFSLKRNEFLQGNWKNGPNLYEVSNKLKLYDHYIIYGFKSMAQFYFFASQSGFSKPYEFWDNNRVIEHYHGIPIVKPNSDVPPNTAIVITAKNPKSIANMISVVPCKWKKNIIVLEEYK